MANEMDDVETMKAPSLVDYAEVVGPEKIAALQQLRTQLPEQAVIHHVNSTRIGGGVAELLRSYGPIFEAIGINYDWSLLMSDRHPDFFTVTREFHDGLQGLPMQDSPGLINQYNDMFFNGMQSDNSHIINQLGNVGEGHYVFVHDPQPHGFLRLRKPGDGSKWYFRLHIDTSTPDPFLIKHFIEQASSLESLIVSAEEFIEPHLNGTPVRYDVFRPGLDPLSALNMPLEQSFLEHVAQKYGLDDGRPTLTLVSRMDLWKGHQDLLDAYTIVRERGYDLRLVFVYNKATDDAKGNLTEAQIKDSIPIPYSGDVHMINKSGGNQHQEQRKVNAIRRLSTILTQPSLREGFGLTAAEALWAPKPLIVNGVGGLRYQVEDGYNGIVLDPYKVSLDGQPIDPRERRIYIESFADRIMYLLDNPQYANSLAQNGRSRVHTIVDDVAAHLVLMAKPKQTH